MELGGGVSKRVTRVALSKLHNLSFRTPSQVNSMGYVVDLIQYAADYIDLDQKKEAVKENTEKIAHYFEEKKDQAVKLVSPAKEVIEKHTADIKETTVKSVVSIVSSIASATELVRRQFIGQVPDVTQLQSNLADVTKRTKEAILKLKEPQLSEYIAYVRSTYTNALESLITLTHAYTPAALSTSPLLATLAGQLQSWRDSLISRLPQADVKNGAKAEPKAEEKTEVKTEVKSEGEKQ